jgi:uncharacterized protein YndB with AHSA1/START domain
MSDEATVTVSTTVEAPGERVYDLVSDITRMGDWSPESQGGRWLDGASGPAVGARFKGRNQRGWRRWSTTCEVTEADPGEAFAFRVTSIGGMRVATWRYRMEPAGSSTTVTEEWTDDRGGTMKVLGRLATGVPDRAEHNRAGMQQTLTALKAAAESPQ